MSSVLSSGKLHKTKARQPDRHASWQTDRKGYSCNRFVTRSAAALQMVLLLLYTAITAFFQVQQINSCACKTVFVCTQPINSMYPLNNVPVLPGKQTHTAPISLAGMCSAHHAVLMSLANVVGYLMMSVMKTRSHSIPCSGQDTGSGLCVSDAGAGYHGVCVRQ